MLWPWGRKRAPKRFQKDEPVKIKPVEQFTKCTFCGHDRFYEGPSGGASQNIECSKCGARFNIGPIPGGPILLDTLSGPKEKETKCRT